MINIVVSQNGSVTGDTGKILGYEGYEFSEIINITHPLFPGTQYFIEYKYDNTILRNKLDGNNRVSIKINNAGYVNCKFVAIDIATGDVQFMSNSWTMIIKESLKIESSHYPCNSHYYSHRHPTVIAHSRYCDNNNGFDAFGAYEKLKAELDNEEDIRFNELQAIRQELVEIKSAIGLNTNVASTLNANTLVTPGRYNANSLSTNFPKTNTEYEIHVSEYGDSNILQMAYEKNSKIVHYRSTILNATFESEWTEWVLMSLPQ